MAICAHPQKLSARQTHDRNTYIYSTISHQKLNYSIHLCARVLNRDAGRHRQCVLPGAGSAGVRAVTEQRTYLAAGRKRPVAEVPTYATLGREPDFRQFCRCKT